MGYTQTVQKFPVPDFTVGTLDSLLSLSDELKKIDGYAESVVKRVAQSLTEATDEGKKQKDKLDQITIVSDSANCKQNV